MRFSANKDDVLRGLESSTIRGRVLMAGLKTGLHRLPRVPQHYRTRSLQTLPNRVLAAALDAISPVAAVADEAIRIPHASSRPVVCCEP